MTKILKGRYKWKNQKSALENIKLLYKSQKTVIELFGEYSLIASEAKHKVKYGGLKINASKITNSTRMSKSR